MKPLDNYWKVQMLKQLLIDIKPKIEELESHCIYNKIKSLESLRFFMQRHVFAVFDFMSLTKSIQSEFSPIKKVWVPPKHRELSRFINEIVLAEESDLVPDNSFMSHFEMYCKAMEEVSADVSIINDFVKRVELEGPIVAAKESGVPLSSQKFMIDTFDIIENGEAHELAASFCFGREKVIPLMFQSLLDKMNIGSKGAPLFYYYLGRHIEIDSDSHGPLALKMLSFLCQEDPKKWEEAKLAAIKSIESRIVFWDSLSAEIDSHKVGMWNDQSISH